MDDLLTYLSQQDNDKVSFKTAIGNSVTNVRYMESLLADMSLNNSLVHSSSLSFHSVDDMSYI